MHPVPLARGPAGVRTGDAAIAVRAFARRVEGGFVVAPVEERDASGGLGVNSDGVRGGALERRERAWGALGEDHLARANRGGGEAAQTAAGAELQDATTHDAHARGTRSGRDGIVSVFRNGAGGGGRDGNVIGAGRDRLGGVRTALGRRGGVEGVREDARGAPDAPGEASLFPRGLVDADGSAGVVEVDELDAGRSLGRGAHLRPAHRHELHRGSVASAVRRHGGAHGVHERLVPATNRAFQALEEKFPRAERLHEACRARVGRHGGRQLQKRVAAGRARGRSRF